MINQQEKVKSQRAKKGTKTKRKGERVKKPEGKGLGNGKGLSKKGLEIVIKNPLQIQ